MRKAHFHLHSIFFPLVCFSFMMLASVFSLPIVSDTAYAAKVSLAWDANSESDLAGYKLYYKSGTGTSYNGTGAIEGNSPVTIYLEDMTNPNLPTYALTGLGDGWVYNFVVTAFTSNGIESDFSNQVNITTAVPVENLMPNANAGADQTVSEGRTVYLSGTNSTDPEGSISGYRWKQVSGPTVVLTDAAKVRASFTAPDVGANGVALSFELQVTDAGGLNDTDTCTVNVTWLNQSPSADAGSDQTVVEGESVFLNGLGSSDPDDAVAQYQWTQTAGPTVVLSNAKSAQPLFVAPVVNQGGAALSFTLKVTDNGGLTASDTCTVNVTWFNDVPTASAGPDKSAIPNEIVTLDGSNSFDPDDGIAAYQWLQKQGPAVTISNPAVASPTFKVPESTTAGTSFVFELTVRDSGGLTSTDDCRINTALPISVVSNNESQGATSKAGETSNTATATEATLTPANTSSNKAPVASAGPDRTAIPNEIVTLNGSKSYDSDGWITTYQWSQKQGPAVSLLKASTEISKFKVPKTVSEGTVLVFELAVMDADGLMSKDECVVTITKSFSIASATGSPGDVVDVESQVVSDTPNNEAVIVTGGGADQTEESSGSVGADPADQVTNGSKDSDTETDNQNSYNGSTEPDTKPEIQNSDNRVPVYPVPAASMGDSPLLGPVELAVNGFFDPDAGDYHSKTQWQVYRTEDKVCVLDSLSSSYLTVFRIPEIMLDENTAYFWRARFFDNHGAASGWSKNISFTTDFSDTDTDGNGIPDDQEVDISVDMNRDGMPDAQQAVVKSIMIPSRNEPIGLSIENASTVTAILSMSAVDALESNFAPEDEEKMNQLPYGLINFKLAVDQPGDKAVVTVHFSQPVSGSAKWVKFDPIKGTWLDYGAYSEFSDDRMSVTLEFVDGGFGDDDGVANGVIIDPSGLDLSPDAESFSMEGAGSVETEITGGGDSGAGGNGGGSGGGCFVTGAMEEPTAGLPLAAACMFLLFGAAIGLRFSDRKLK